ncbi:MAG: fluoride efflux transporter CrcB [Methylobacillus glycogenes]|nr:fluoride efflux transporter CrcB [Methylobacillus glycogenes]
MQHICLVALGGALGSLARYKLSGLILQQAAQLKFPLGTFTVNILGCLVIGALAGLAERSGSFSTEWRLFLFTGLLGGFTTFSAFGLETMMLVKQGEWVIALSYISLSIIVGLALLFAGYYLLK